LYRVGFADLRPRGTMQSILPIAKRKNGVVRAGRTTPFSLPERDREGAFIRKGISMHSFFRQIFPARNFEKKRGIRSPAPTSRASRLRKRFLPPPSPKATGWRASSRGPSYPPSFAALRLFRRSFPSPARRASAS